MIGRNSFLAREFLARNSDLRVRAIGHQDVPRDDQYRGVACVINFAFSPALYEREYDISSDVDREAARRARERGAHYVMISSRRVYDTAVQWNAREDSETRGRDAYGRNKARIERELQTIMRDRLTILRPGSVVGFEATPGRQRVAAYMQNQLVSEGRIRLTIAASTRRDLVPIGFFCRVLRQAVSSREPGVFNVGSGVATPIGDAARWIIDGFGSGELVEENSAVSDEFFLDVSRLGQAFRLSCRTGELEKCLRDSGVRLARRRGRLD